MYFRRMYDVTIWSPEEVGKVDETLVEKLKNHTKKLALFPL